MLSRKTSKLTSSSSANLIILADSVPDLNWDEPPLYWLSPQQRAQFKHQAQTKKFKNAELEPGIWQS